MGGALSSTKRRSSTRWTANGSSASFSGRIPSRARWRPLERTAGLFVLAILRSTSRYTYSADFLDREAAKAQCSFVPPSKISNKIRYARMWPRSVFDQGQQFLKDRELAILEEPGVYVLHRDDLPYYVGKGSKLGERLWHHANTPGSRYYNFLELLLGFCSNRRNRRGSCRPDRSYSHRRHSKRKQRQRHCAGYRFRGS